MNVDKAAQLTFNVARLQKKNWRDPPCRELSFDHIQSMIIRWSDDMSETKKCRWLGWMQATVVAMTHPYTSLETMKNINLNCAESPKEAGHEHG